MMSVWFVKRLPILLYLMLAITPGLATAQVTQRPGFLYIRPVSADSALQPYVFQLVQADEAFGIIFPETVIVTLFAPLNSPLNLQVNPIVPHIPSGGYRLQDTIIWSAFTYGLDSTNALDLNSSAFEPLRDEGAIDDALLVGTRPQVVEAGTELLVISPTLYTPVTSGERYEQCSIREDVKGVMAFDFAQDTAANPVFQIVQLQGAPIRFRLPSFIDPLEFIAVANNVSPNNTNIQVERFSRQGDQLGGEVLLERDVFARAQGEIKGSQADYTRLFQTLTQASSQMFPLFVQVMQYQPATQFMELNFRSGPECRSLVPNTTVITPLSGNTAEGVPYYMQGREDASGTLKPDDIAIVRGISSDSGRICFDMPNQPLEEGTQAIQVCADGWRLMVAESAS